MLSGLKIIEEVEKGTIEIEPFNRNQVNPHSYNVRLDNKLLIYTLNKGYLDVKKDNPYEEIIIPEEGYILQPGILYLGKTIERTHTDIYAPAIDGRSSSARLGILVHYTAGYGDAGFDGNWTLEISVVHPVKIYPGIEIAQVYFDNIEGEVELYRGKYHKATEAQTSRYYKEFMNKE